LTCHDRLADEHLVRGPLRSMWRLEPDACLRLFG
jgi:hypothetical protein